MQAKWSGSPPTGITDIKSQADVDKAVTDVPKAGYPTSQRINVNNLNPTRFPLDAKGNLPNAAFGELCGSLHDVIQSARKVLGDDAIRGRLDTAIYSMDNIHISRLDAYAKAMPQTLQNYITQQKLNINAATLPDGTVDWPTTLGSDPKASEYTKDKLKAIQTGDWSTIDIKPGKEARGLRASRNHAIACGNSAQFLSDLKGCAPA